MRELVRPSLVVLAAMTLVTGAAYPAAVTAAARLAFPRLAGGSLVERGGRVVGSELVGQPFASPRYFWGRPSATAPGPYNAAASGGSNSGPLRPELSEAVRSRVGALRRADPGLGPVPVDLATASGSGLDPHVSPASASAQVRRVAAARGRPESEVRDAVRRRTEPRQFGVLGEPRVNVLLLNLDLDADAPPTAPPRPAPPNEPK